MNDIDRITRVIEWTPLSTSVSILAISTDSTRYVLTTIREARFTSVGGASHARKRTRYVLSIETLVGDSVKTETRYFGKYEDAVFDASIHSKMQSFKSRSK
jgi:hypothetical protein